MTTRPTKAARDLQDQECFLYLDVPRHVTEPPKTRSNVTTVKVNLDSGKPGKLTLPADTKLELLTQPRQANQLQVGDTFAFLGMLNTLTKEPSQPNGQGIVSLSVITPGESRYTYKVLADAKLDVQV